MFLADNLAKIDLVGFKLSFSFDFRSCRSCLATKESYKSIYSPASFELRTKSEHLKQLAMLNCPTAEHFSKTYMALIEDQL